jgi:hypothetical protein
MTGETERIARDLDDGAVRGAVRRFQAAGVEITVRAIAAETGIETHRVEPVLRAIAEERPSL